ncbi:MAG: mechanosensitive ion channel [Clostridia bacterium]|nr:mechanosensitive ion channel [Clostridia bacterium]
MFLESIKEFFTDKAMVEFIIRILVAIAFLFIGSKVAKVISRRIVKSKGMMRLNKTIRTFLGHVIAICLYIVVAIVTIMILGLELSAFSAALASAGLAIGLALQGGLSNIAGGVMVVAFKPFEVGDYVEAAGVGGTVTDIGIFYTTLTTPDNKKVVIPNGTVSNAVVTNYSAHDTRRIDFDFTIAYTADIDVAKKVLYACAQADERILTDPAANVMITSHNDSSIGIKLRVWVKSEDYWDVNFAIIEQVKRSFDQFGVEIPFPQLDVHIAK